jgi:hypothetical protein
MRAVEGDLFTTLPTETGSPLAARNRAGGKLAAGVRAVRPDRQVYKKSKPVGSLDPAGFLFV